MKKMSVITRMLSLTLGSILALTPHVQADSVSIEINKPAPDFSLPSADGSSVKLSSFKGKVVVIEWLNHECPFVKKHYGVGNMQKLQSSYTGKGVVWLSINSSAEGKQGHLTAESANKIRTEKNAVPSHTLLDADGKVGRLYGAKTTPHMFVIDAEGIVRYMGAIDSTPSTDSDDIPNSKNYVAAAVDSLLNGKAVEEQVTQPYGCSVKYAL